MASVGSTLEGNTEPPIFLDVLRDHYEGKVALGCLRIDSAKSFLVYGCVSWFTGFLYFVLYFTPLILTLIT